MTFFILAKNEAGDDWLTDEIEADTWEDAVEELRRLARLRWPGQVWRPTSVTERPEILNDGPLALSVYLGRAVGERTYAR